MDQASGTLPLHNEITEESFRLIMKDVCCLIGKPEPPREQLKLFFMKVQKQDLRDFTAACNDYDLLKDWSQRRNLCWPTLQDAIIRARNIRIDAENKAMKRKEEFIREKIPVDVREMIDQILERKKVE
jgi:hypothetical protein